MSLFNTLLSYSSNLSIFWIYKQLKLCGYITISIWQKQNSKLIQKFFSPFCIGMWCFHSAVSMHNFDCFVYVLTINISTVFLLFKLHPFSLSLFTIILPSTLIIKILYPLHSALFFIHLNLLLTHSTKLNILVTQLIFRSCFLLSNFSFSTPLMPVSFLHSSLPLLSVRKRLTVMELGFSDAYMCL